MKNGKANHSSEKNCRATNIVGRKLTILVLLVLSLGFGTLTMQLNNPLTFANDQEAIVRRELEGNSTMNYSLDSDFHPFEDFHYPSATPLSQIIDDSAHGNNANNSIESSNTNNRNQATCEFRELEMSHHFPHSMQQLYRCVSHWLAHPTSKSVLLLPKTGKAPNAYAEGFIAALQEVFDLRVERAESLQWKNKSVYPLTEGNVTGQTISRFNKSFFQMESPRHAMHMRQQIVQHYDLNTTHHEDCSQLPTAQQQPVIGFLNRQGGRRVSNYDDILDRLRAN